MKHVIFAPHPDDELIGCWRMLRTKARARHCLVVYVDACDMVRRAEAEGASKALGFHMDALEYSTDLASYVETLRSRIHLTPELKSITLWAPDPHWELHPLHKLVGSHVHAVALRAGVRFGTYSTNMNAPYLGQIADPEHKRAALDKYYPSQQSLWEHDHRYFLFEGRALWNPPVP